MRVGEPERALGRVAAGGQESQQAPRQLDAGREEKEKEGRKTDS